MMARMCISHCITTINLTWNVTRYWNIYNYKTRVQIAPIHFAIIIVNSSLSALARDIIRIRSPGYTIQAVARKYFAEHSSPITERRFTDSSIIVYIYMHCENFLRVTCIHERARGRKSVGSFMTRFRLVPVLKINLLWRERERECSWYTWDARFFKSAARAGGRAWLSQTDTRGQKIEEWEKSRRLFKTRKCFGNWERGTDFFNLFRESFFLTRGV